jgi:N-acetylglucosamine kinase-like BadF-type ATPase
MSTPLFVGIDAGGTKTAARAAAGTDRRRFVGPAAQATRDGAAAAAASVGALIDTAREAYPGAPLGGIVVGLAGAGSTDTQAAVAAALRAHLGDVPLDVTHDADVALEAAWGGESGSVLIVGTGSVVVARTVDGALVRAGGWGPALGDDGSGTSLGRAALRAALAALDGGPPTTLADRLAETHGLSAAASIVAAAHASGESLSRFAPVLLAAAADDDWVAISALSRETNALAQQVGWLATRAGETVVPRLALAGGLASEPVYVAALSAALARHLPGWMVVETAVDPSDGALARAQRLASPT